MISYLNVSLKLSALCVAMMTITSAAYALEKLDENDLAAATGEGIAILPTETSFRLNGANSTSSLSTEVTDNSNPGTGYVHIIPVGPLSKTVQTANASATYKTGKADLYLYGLALSKNDNNVNTQYSNSEIATWGTAQNPWIIKVTTASNIPNFSTSDSGTYPVSYLSLEAPLFNGVVTATTGTTTTQTTKPTTSATGADAYNLKLGLWADAFVRDSSVVEGSASQFCLNGCTRNTSATNTAQIPRENRMRLQTIWNGFGINGTDVKIFQTLNGATDTSYNNTLGLAALVRLNSSDTGVLRLSTQETTASGLLTTPAINAGAMPTFNANEGLYLQKLNVNFALGSIYQPVVLGATDDGNIVFEVTRIPNKASVYNQIYTNYSAPNSTTYKGVTCSQFYCGGDGSSTTYQTAGTVGTTNYRNPTHSSITIGDVIYNNATRTISANTNPTNGVVFKDSSGTATNLGSVAIDGVLIQHLKITTKGL